MRIALFQAPAHPLCPKVLAEDDVTSKLSMYTRVSEWVDIEFPPLPPEDYLSKQREILAAEEQELREKLSRVSQARATLQSAS